MKTYFVLRDWTIGFDCSNSPQIDIYLDLETAKEKFLTEVNAAIIDSELMCSENELVKEYVNEHIDSGSALYSVSQEGRWCENHIQVQLGYQEISEPKNEGIGTLIKNLYKHPDCVAATIWTKEDIKSVLEENGFKPSEENVNEVMNISYLSGLGEATSDDWDTIRSAIDDCRDALEKC